MTDEHNDVNNQKEKDKHGGQDKTNDAYRYQGRDSKDNKGYYGKPRITEQV
jgi:hypothetical protein